MTRLRRSVLALAATTALLFAACSPASATSTSGTDSRTVSGRAFASTSPFYQKLPASTPVASDSSGLVSSLVSQAHKYYGTATRANVDINTSTYTPPLYVAYNSDPSYNITGWNCQGKSGNWAGEFNTLMQGVHLPSDMQPDPSSDGNVSIYNPNSDEVVELWQARKVNGGWQACWGGRITHASSSLGIFPVNYGASAGGLSFWAYTIRQQELLNGHIDHVINLAIPLTKKGSYSWPANRTDGWVSGTQLSEGQLLRLPASLDIDSMKLSPVAKTIAKAAQEYGIMITDTSGAVQFSAENSIGLANNQYSSIFRGRWAAQEMAGNAALGEVPFPLDKLVALPIDYKVPTSGVSSAPRSHRRTPTTPTTPTTPAAANKTYASAVKKGKPYLYWKLSDKKASAADSSGHKRKGVLNNVTTSVAGAIAGNKAIRTYGTAESTVYRSVKSKPGKSFTEQVWFNTLTTAGGKLAGLENAKLHNGSRYDRSIYMTNDGRVAFGTYSGTLNIVTSAKGYNDGAWHMATATQGSDGTKLYIDGALVASSTVTTAQSGSGYWRLGGGSLAGWTNQPTSSYFSGSLDEFAVFNTALSATAVAALYDAAT